MIKVTIKNIRDYNLPLDNNSKVMSRGCSKEVLEELEAKYNRKTNVVCRKISLSGFEIYVNTAYTDIIERDKDKWIVNYEVYIRSSFVYKYWIFVKKLQKKFNM